ncbi:hypothetical protein [uncultured Treponema sp.]|uniref:hypothetical protein n=1 Tax=uncultured Treponema sp. TaxID=162155 RepID=UPI0025F29F3A|nr:hypothetical protein [uncultured Treponema sp.]
MDEERLFKEIISTFPVLLTYEPEKIIEITNKFQNFLLDYKATDNFPRQSDLVNEYLESVSPEYKKEAEKAISKFDEFCLQQNIPFFKVNGNDIVAFVKEAYSNGMSQGIVRVLVSRVRKFYSFIYEKKLLISNPFDDVKLSEIDYKCGEQYLIPSEEEVQEIINSLPIEKAVILAVISVKAYSDADFLQASFSYAEFENLNQKILVDGVLQGTEISVAYCYRPDENWNAVEPEGWIISESDGAGFRGYYEYINSPQWYNDLLARFWEKISRDHVENEYYGIGEAYFSNKNISFQSCKNIILKQIKKLYSEGKIKHPYGLKNFRYFAVLMEYSKSHNLESVKKMLNHSTLNTTKRFLQNIGINV